MKELAEKQKLEDLRKLHMERKALINSPIQKKQLLGRESSVSESGAEQSLKTTSNDLASHLRSSAKGSKKLVQNKLSLVSQQPSEHGMHQFEVSAIPLTHVMNINCLIEFF